MHPASPYIIAVAAILMVAVYPFAWWRRVSFTTTTVLVNTVIFVLYIAPSNVEIYRDVVLNLGYANTSLETGEGLWGMYTHMYIHANVIHILFNMLILYLMGSHFEERVGFGYMALVYWTTGALGGGALNALVTLPSGPVIGVGASGAISGIIGAFAMMYPNDRVPMVLGFILLPRVQVAFGALVFILFETFLMFFAVSLPGIGNVSHTAHLLGVAVGIAVGLALAKKGVERPTPGARLGRQLDRLDYTGLGQLARRPSERERYEALVAEDIPEVKQVLLEDLVSRLRCPQCSSILTLKGRTVRCEGCEWQLDLRKRG